uniref:Calmodulin n=1 Tax=Macrostomum lignano TaxID=282301 RepID=A0A1I8HQV7_9PLAT
MSSRGSTKQPPATVAKGVNSNSGAGAASSSSSSLANCSRSQRNQSPGSAASANGGAASLEEQQRQQHPEFAQTAVHSCDRLGPAAAVSRPNPVAKQSRLKGAKPEPEAAAAAAAPWRNRRRPTEIRGNPAIGEAFNFFDIDHDGRITAGELHKVLKFLGTKVTENEVKMMIADVDSDGNGTVEFNEFLKMMKKYYRKNAHCHTEDADMWEAFKAFDHNGDNYIDFAEIKKTMHFLGEEVSDEDVQSMINEADADNDGRINFEEFKKMMLVMQQRGENHC